MDNQPKPVQFPELLYYQDSNLLECEAQVVQVVEIELPLAQHPQLDSAHRLVDLVLDQTIFYPEGGGQPWDLGTIQGFSVIQVQKKDGLVYHRILLELSQGLLSPGQRVTCKVDSHRRRDYQQQHTGQHILSACLLVVGDHETLSVHQGEEYLMIETSKPEISQEEIEKIQAKANSIIEENVLVRTQWVTDQEIHRYPLRRKPKVSGAIRLVMIGEYDCVACGGVHLERTGQVRVIQHLGTEKIRGRIRTIWKVGDRALADYQTKTQITRRLGESFSAPLAKLESAVQGKLEELTQLQRAYNKTLGDMAALFAQNFLKHPEQSTQVQVSPKPYLIVHTFDQKEKEFIRRVAVELSQESQVLALLINSHGNLSQEEKQDFSWTLVVGSATGFDFSSQSKHFMELLGAKGGGKPPIYQGIGTLPLGINLCVEYLEDLLA